MSETVQEIVYGRLMPFLEENEAYAVAHRVHRLMRLDDLSVGYVGRQRLVAAVEILVLYRYDAIDVLARSAPQMLGPRNVVRHREERKPPRVRGAVPAKLADDVLHDGVCDQVVEMPTDAVRVVRHDHVRLHLIDVLADDILKIQWIHPVEAPVWIIKYGKVIQIQNAGHLLHFVEADSSHFLL